MNSMHPRDSYPIEGRWRWLLVLWSLLLVGGFVLAFSLEPDPRFFGTHQRLGLPPCSFRDWFDLPCPSCGMTTCFAHFTRGQFSDAARANLAGLALAVLCAVQIPWCWWSAYQGRTWCISEPLRSAV